MACTFISISFPARTGLHAILLYHKELMAISNIKLHFNNLQFTHHWNQRPSLKHGQLEKYVYSTQIYRIFNPFLTQHNTTLIKNKYIRQYPDVTMYLFFPSHDSFIWLTNRIIQRWNKLTYPLIIGKWKWNYAFFLAEVLSFSMFSNRLPS